MIKGKTIFVAHNWSDVSVSYQSKWLATEFSNDNQVVFLNAKKSGTARQLINDKLLLCEWPGKRPNGIRDLLFAIRLFRRYRPQLIISNFAANDIMLFVASLFGVKVRLCYYHTMVQQYIEDYGLLGLRQRINIWRKGFAFRRATHILTLSAAAKKDIVQYYKVDPARCHVFPNALPERNIRNCNSSYVIGFLGRLDHSKGVDILLLSFKAVAEKYPGIKLIITGSGTEELLLKRMCAENDLNGHVCFNGKLPYTEVPAFLASLDFLVVPSRIDNLPTVILEALSVGTPVIGSATGGIPDIIEDNYNSLLFEPENVQHLTDQMLRLLYNRVLRDQLSVNARISFEKKYSIRQHRQRFEELIEGSL